MWSRVCGVWRRAIQTDAQCAAKWPSCCEMQQIRECIDWPRKSWLEASTPNNEAQRQEGRVVPKHESELHQLIHNNYCKKEQRAHELDQWTFLNHNRECNNEGQLTFKVNVHVPLISSMAWRLQLLVACEWCCRSYANNYSRALLVCTCAIASNKYFKLCYVNTSKMYVKIIIWLCDPPRQPLLPCAPHRSRNTTWH